MGNRLNRLQDGLCPLNVIRPLAAAQRLDRLPVNYGLPPACKRKLINCEPRGLGGRDERVRTLWHRKITRLFH